MKTELERLKVLSALKLGYGKLTAKNTTEAEFKDIEDAMEIVKKCSIPAVSDTIYDIDWEVIQTAPHGIQYKHKVTGETKWE